MFRAIVFTMRVKSKTMASLLGTGWNIFRVCIILVATAAFQEVRAYHAKVEPWVCCLVGWVEGWKGRHLNGTNCNSRRYLRAVWAAYWNRPPGWPPHCPIVTFSGWTCWRPATPPRWASPARWQTSPRLDSWRPVSLGLAPGRFASSQTPPALPVPALARWFEFPAAGHPRGLLSWWENISYLKYSNNCKLF